MYMPRKTGSGDDLRLLPWSKKKYGPSNLLLQRSSRLSPDLDLPALTHPGEGHKMPGIANHRGGTWKCSPRGCRKGSTDLENSDGPRNGLVQRRSTGDMVSRFSNRGMVALVRWSGLCSVDARRAMEAGLSFRTELGWCGICTVSRR